MPVYEYKCEGCGEVFEYQQKISEPALTKCPDDVTKHKNHGNGKITRQFSKNVGLVFNGKGFYLTDYKNKTTSPAPTE